MFHLLRNCNLLAPEALGVRDLLVAGERIAWLGEVGEPLPSWLPVQVTDLEGRTVIPALIWSTNTAHARLGARCCAEGWGIRCRRSEPALVPFSRRPLSA